MTPAETSGGTASKLADLISLAAEPSSERRREVLRQVTDLFMNSPEGARTRGAEAFGGVMNLLCADMELAVQEELAQRLAPMPDAPIGVLRRLASQDIRVAAPVLSLSPALTEADLLGVVRTQGQAHLRLVSARKSLTEGVSDVIVERGDDVTLGVLLKNQDAPLSRRSAEAVVDRAMVNPDLHEAVVERRTLPADLLNEMYFTVESRLRSRIAARNASIDPAALEAALAAGRKRMAVADGLLPPDYADAEIFVRGLAASGTVLAHALPGMLRKNERTRFLIALAELSEVDFGTAKHIIDNRDLDALAILSKAAAFDRSLFMTLAVLIDGAGEGLAKAETYGRLYGQLSRETAERTLRFWRMRQDRSQAA